jgi:dienelactone hydrolase
MGAFKTYSLDGKTYEAYVAYPNRGTAPYPAVLVFHAWAGRDAFSCKKADQLAELGYVGIALDLYGEGQVGRNNSENQRLMEPLIQNRLELRRRALSGLEFAKTLPQINSDKIAAIGFCFGGLCALDLARSGAQLSGVVSFHGLLMPAQGFKNELIHSKILALHGHDDPMVKPQDVLEFEKEMTHCQADWQVHVYGQTMHAFTNDQANDPSFGTVYHPLADQRAWKALRNFLEEVFS